jgi:carbon storage regulator
MLVLSRKQGEVIVIGDDVTVTVLEVQGNRVKLGFTAPDEMPIRRQELHPRVERCQPALAPRTVLPGWRQTDGRSIAARA